MNKIIIISLALLTSCTCNYHIKRATAKCGTMKRDTLIVRDTVRIASVERDTVFNYYQRDTVIIREGRLTMKYFYNSHDSTVYLKGKCDTVFVPFEIKVPIETVIIKEAWFKRFWWLWLLVGLSAIYAILKR